MTRRPEDTRIAGRKTVRDWRELEGKLTASRKDEALWQEAFNDFFKERIETRYLTPVKTLNQLSNDNGEGFSIVTIYCSLIEFLESTLTGKTYRYRKKSDPPLGENEYSNSRREFVSFLRGRPQFKAMFPTEGDAEDFFENVRCALLHEASTRGEWRIVVDEGAPISIDAHMRIVVRNKLPESFESFFDWYKGELLSDFELQAAFLRKFDGLCQN